MYGKAPLLTPLAVGFRGLFGIIVSSLNEPPPNSVLRIPILRPHSILATIREVAAPYLKPIVMSHVNTSTLVASMLYL